MMFSAAAVAILIASLLTLYRVITGPTLYDRVLATNVIGSKTVVLLSLIGFIYGRPHFMDIALLYALINFIATIAILRYIERERVD